MNNENTGEKASFFFKVWHLTHAKKHNKVALKEKPWRVMDLNSLQRLRSLLDGIKRQNLLLLHCKIAQKDHCLSSQRVSE